MGRCSPASRRASSRRRSSRTSAASSPARRARRPDEDRLGDGARARRPGGHRARAGRSTRPAAHARRARRAARPGARTRRSPAPPPTRAASGSTSTAGSTWALGELDGVVPGARELAWDEYTRNTLAAHATAFPDHWNGTISVDDACNGWYSSDPSRCGIGVPFFSGQITEQPTWMVMNALRLAGLTPTRDGYRIDPHLPQETLHRALSRARASRASPASCAATSSPSAAGRSSYASAWTEAVLRRLTQTASPSPTRRERIRRLHRAGQRGPAAGLEARP